MTLGMPRAALPGKTETILTPMKPSPARRVQAGIRSSVAVSPARSIA